MTVTRISKTAWVYLVVMQVLLLGVTTARLFLTRRTELFTDECFACQAMTLVQHDAGIWAIAWLILLALSWPVRALRAVAVLLLLSLFLLLLGDLVVLDQFSMRLYLGDALKFGQQPLFAFTYLGNALGAMQLAAGFILLLAFIIATLRVHSLHANRGYRLFLLGAFILSLALYSLPDRSEHPLPWTYQNLVEANWPTGADRPYSEEYLGALFEEPPEALNRMTCEAGLGHGSNVVMVLFESLSWYHSSLLLDDSLQATPGLDTLARKNAWWEGFHANGFTTDHGLIAMLAGQLPVPAVNRYHSFQVFDGYENGEGSLTRRLAADGYYSAFFTSGDLGFLGKKDWLEALRFDRVEGHDFAGYDGLDRFEFNSVSDDHLYRRVSDWIRNEHPGPGPFLAVVETVSTHPPFTDPVTGTLSEAGAFRFADRALSEFVRDLESTGFFENGLIIVTSDQRALTGIRRSEKQAFGYAAGARLPLVMKGGRLELAGRQSQAAQMMDLPYSLDYFLTAEACRSGDQGNLFTSRPPDCIFQPEGNRRDVINAFCGDDQARILLDGDDTRVIEGNLPDEQERLRELNYLRARLGVRETNIHLVL